MTEELVADIVLAVNEAVANSIEHGYQGRKPGKIRLKGENDGARVRSRSPTRARGSPRPPIPAAGAADYY